MSGISYLGCSSGLWRLAVELIVMSIIFLVVVTNEYFDVLMSSGGEHKFAHGTYFIFLVCETPGDFLNNSKV